MGDNYTEVTSESWGERMKKSIGGIAGGILLFLLSFGVLFWNEGNSLRNIKALNEMGKAAVSVSSKKVDASNEGKLVHTNGKAKTADVLHDQVFNVSVAGIKLVRTVEMYQWKENVKTEKKEKAGGTKETIKTYSYQKTWSSTAIDSSSFKKEKGHSNPGMEIKSKNFTAQNVNLGEYQLNAGQIESISGEEPFTVDKKVIKAMSPAAQKIVKLNNGGLYIGKNASAPEVGDYRISFQIIKPGKEISVIAVQKGKTFVPFTAKNGKEKQLLQMGALSKDQMITAALKGNQMMTWIYRLAGFLMMFGGLQLLFKPLSTMGAVLPVLGNIIEMGTSLVAGLISIALSTFTIAVAWMFFRPLVGILLLLITAAAVGGLVFLKKKNTGTLVEQVAA